MAFSLLKVLFYGFIQTWHDFYGNIEKKNTWYLVLHVSLWLTEAYDAFNKYWVCCSSFCAWKCAFDGFKCSLLYFALFHLSLTEERNILDCLDLLLHIWSVFDFQQSLTVEIKCSSINLTWLLTVNEDSDGVLHQVGPWHHHAAEGLLVFERGLGDEQAEPVVDTDPLGVIVCGLNCGLLTAGLFDQQITKSAVLLFLKRQSHFVNLYITVPYSSAIISQSVDLKRNVQKQFFIYAKKVTIRGVTILQIHNLIWLLILRSWFAQIFGYAIIRLSSLDS